MTIETETDRPVHESSWRITIFDIANGGGFARVTLRSGVQLFGAPDKEKSMNEVLFMHHKGGWHVIDWSEIAAITGEPANRVLR